MTGWARAALVALMLPLCTATARAEPVLLHTGTAHRALFAIDFDGAQGYAVGALGRILHTPDSGGSWVAEDSGVDLALLGVAAQGTHRLAVGQSGLALRRDENGRWQRVGTGTTERLMGVAVDGDGIATAVGSFGTLLRSEDGGARWARVDIDWSRHVEGGFEPHLYAVQAMGNGSFVVAGEYGLILRSDNGGHDWVKVHGSEASLFGLQLRADGTGYAVGQSGTALRTQDGGRSWTTLATGTEANLLGVWSSTDGRVVVSGMRHVMSSRDGGASWRHLADADTRRVWYAAVGAAHGSAAALIVGQGERISRLGD